MPYENRPTERVYVHEEYPKMLVKDGKPVIYPAGHEKQGLPVIFENEDDEKAYSKPAKKVYK